MHVRESHSFRYPQRPEESIGSLDLELQKVVSHQAGAKSQTQVLWKSRAISGPSASSFVQFPSVLFSGNFPQLCDLAIVLNFQCGNPVFTHQISHALVLSVFKRLIFK